MFKIPQIDIDIFKEQNIHFGIFHNDVTVSVFSATGSTYAQRVLNYWVENYMPYREDKYHIGVLRPDCTEHVLYMVEFTGKQFIVLKRGYIDNVHYQDIGKIKKTPTSTPQQ